MGYQSFEKCMVQNLKGVNEVGRIERIISMFSYSNTEPNQSPEVELLKYSLRPESC